LWLSVPYPSNCQGNLASILSSNCHHFISSNWRGLISGPEFLLKWRRDPAEITHMFFGITGLYFAARPTPPVPVQAGRQPRRWGALLAVAGLALPGVSAARLTDARPSVVPVVEASRTESPGVLAALGFLSGAAGDDTAPATAAPWEAGVVEADGKPLPTAPPPGPVPVNGIPLPAVATAVAGPADDLVPADREYLRPILVRYAQENGLAADLVMSLAWVESTWRKNATSGAGAVGVMQLMPNTVEFVSKRLLGLRSNLDPRNPTSNVRMGAKYLRHLLDQNRGNVRQALIAYNQGLTSLRLNGSYRVAERYADRVLALRPQFRTA
jgi:soluble lytic murein transglycosylase-like protein